MNTAVVVLYFNKINITSDCINSLFNQNIPGSQIYAFSNGSEPSFYENLKERYPLIMHRHNKENRGFSGGFNESLKWAFLSGFDSALFMTNDTIIGKNALDSCIETSLQTGSGLIAPTIYYLKRSNKIDSSAGFFDRERFTLSHYHSTHNPQILEKNDYIPGTALFITKNVFEKLEGMDEFYNTYWDDADFSFRAHKAGIKQARSFKAGIFHKVGQTCHKKPLYTTFYFQRNRVLFCKKFLRGKELIRALNIIDSETDEMLNRIGSEKDIIRQKYLEEIKLLIRN